jgi:hypothetical protein
MSDYNWCHGPLCHKRPTTTRVRGVKGSKVLRSVKINVSGAYPKGVWKYFCDQTCMHDFIATHIEQFVQLHPRTECLETPIEVQTIKHPEETTEYGWTRKAWTEKRITEVDND